MDRICVIPSIAHGSDQGSDHHFGDILDDADFSSTHDSPVKSSLSLPQEFFKIAPAAPAYGVRIQAPVVRSLVKAYCKILEHHETRAPQSRSSSAVAIHINTTRPRRQELTTSRPVSRCTVDWSYSRRSSSSPQLCSWMMYIRI